MPRYLFPKMIFIFSAAVLFSCGNHPPDKMTPAEADDIITEIKQAFNSISRYSETAKLDSFMSYYANISGFRAISADGVIRNYDEYKKICTEYYTALQEQKVMTTRADFQIIDSNLVIVSSTCDIIATMKNGDIVNTHNYSITSVFKKISGSWKIIHDQESSLPPEVIKK
jgi:ketosteroid isomerase-like protein